MAYVQSKVMKKRLQEKRRVSGAALLREELNNDSNGGSSLLDGLPAFQQNKGVMMANFEEWIKMATDNKINSTNSWNFALIDYFHDMNVLRESDNNINFQKASATLDGCVKIYSSRVDSVATETGRLLSGLATRKDSESNRKDDEEEDDDDNESGKEDEDENELRTKNDDAYEDEGTKKKSKSMKSKESYNTLATWDSIRIKKLSLELAIDPLFKKTLSEFDEGGAKSLLLNTLSMDNHSRVVFDAGSSKANKESHEDDEEDEVDEDIEMSGIDQEDIDISPFKNYIFENDTELENFTICPSMGHLESVLKDINKAKSILSDVNQKNIEEPSEIANFDFDFNGGDDYGDDNGDSFGELEEEAAAVIFQDEIAPDQTVANGDETGIVASVVDQDLMAYFDNTMKRNWAGPEHWKVKQFKKEKANELKNQLVPNGQKAKKVKENFVIDFVSSYDEDEDAKLEKLIFAKSKASTTIPQDQWNSSDTNLLPDDLYFSSAQLTTLFLKPSQKLNLFRKRVNVRASEATRDSEEPREVDATFWAENYEQKAKDDEDAAKTNNDDDDNAYDMDFGGFDDYGGDYGDVESTQPDEKTNFGTQLITGGAKVKPEYVNYSKTAKNVNVKKLKDNIWKVMERKETSETEQQFSSVVKDIGRLYPREQKKDLSTSFCFICLLHLANEHSLTIENNEDLTDLKITQVN